jgi:hypothetical protein
MHYLGLISLLQQSCINSALAGNRLRRFTAYFIWFMRQLELVFLSDYCRFRRANRFSGGAADVMNRHNSVFANNLLWLFLLRESAP